MMKVYIDREFRPTTPVDDEPRYTLWSINPITALPMFQGYYDEFNRMSFQAHVLYTETYDSSFYFSDEDGYLKYLTGKPCLKLVKKAIDLRNEEIGKATDIIVRALR